MLLLICFSFSGWAFLVLKSLWICLSLVGNVYRLVDWVMFMVLGFDSI